MNANPGSIARYRETLRRWGLSDVPFRATPPEDAAELTRLFYGRQRELDLALPALYEGRNVLVRGLCLSHPPPVQYDLREGHAAGGDDGGCAH